MVDYNHLSERKLNRGYILIEASLTANLAFCIQTNNAKQDICKSTRANQWPK